MRRWTTVLASGAAPAAVVDRWLGQIAADASGHASRVLDDKAGEGDIVWVRAAADAAPAEPVAGLRVTDDVPVVPLAGRVVPMHGERFMRTLLLRVRQGSDPASVELMESSLMAMPAHISSIRSWSLSRVDPARTTAGWTHLWEQEFAEPGGFRPYMGHPYHWTGVERWFDPEVPGHIVDGEAHYLSPVPGAVIIEHEEN